MTESFNWLGRCARAAAFGIAALLLLTIARIVFFFAYKNDDLGFLSDFVPAMVMGLRVDAKWRERQKFCVHGIIGARQTGASNEHEHQTQFS